MPLIPGTFYEETADKARRNSGRFPWPKWAPRTLREWIGSILVLLFVALTSGLVYFVARPVSDAPSLQSGAVTKPQTESAQPVPNVQENAVAAPIFKEWPKMQVEWTEVTPTPGAPITSPIKDDGIYTGTGRHNTESLAFIIAILPQLDEGGRAAAARDSLDKDIVFVSINSYSYPIQNYLLVSFNGEESWCEVNLPSLDAPLAGVPAVRVKIENGFVHLTARDNTVQEKLWGTTIKRGDC